MAPGRMAGQSSRIKKRHADASRKSGDRKGNARNFITRTQAVKKLQLSLPDFRKLCIWKGIYPREPRAKKKVVGNSNASTTFYYFKDIQYLLHEPLVAKFRDQKVLEKKISKALGRGDVTDAARWERNAARPELTGKPRYTLDHVIRERYPTFVDALRDLDDCLSMLFLFANLPSTSTVPAKMIARCERLCSEFQHYLIVSHSLRKSFLSIKGIYYQANIMGEDILWLVPYKFNQRVVGDVDFRIMGTFIEFYMTLLGFINFRLYTGIGLKYPPRFDQKKDEQGGELGAFTLEGTNPVANEDESDLPENGTIEHGPDPETQAKVNKLVKQLQSEEQANGKDEKPAEDADEEQATETFDKFEPVAPGGDVLAQPSYSTNDPSRLFSKCTFFLSRETPRQPLEFLLRAFGCKRVGWDSVLGEGAYTTDPLDPSITHHVVDRPVMPLSNDAEDGAEDNQTSQKIAPNQRIPGRLYVQPQWIWDCINDEELKQANLYAPGAQLPPHLSPFVKSVQGQYDPTVPLEEQQTEAEALQDSDAELDEEDEDEEMEDDINLAEKLLENGGDMDIAGDSDSDASNANADETFGGFSDDDANASSDDEATAAQQRQRELEAELTGKPVRSKEAPVDAKTKAKAEARKVLAKQTRQELEDLERAKGMLPKKKRKLYEQMVYTNKKKDTESEKLRAKRRRLEREAAAKKA